MIYFAKMNDKAILPSKRVEDAGYDIYACCDDIAIATGETKLIPTGIASAFSDDYVAIIKERSSLGKLGLGVRGGVIDSGYRGEWKIAMTNHSNQDIVISTKKAIVQCIFVEVPKIKVQEIEYNDLLKIKSERGVGGFGSSGK
ncbi:MAG: dUTP pyrophosphatase [Epulopiscium sp. Nuni2H_MBin003]|nr:MAG: dUTP pyrophosphatase [Epulopiscium sp. Nuni2H_MBin003]